MKACATCGDPLPPRTTTGRPRIHCEACKPPRRRSGQVAEISAATAPVGPPADTSGVYGATFAELAAAGRADTAKGRAALLLAERLDERIDTAAGAAAAVKQLREALDDALAGARVAADPVDELRRRREAKFA